MNVFACDDVAQKANFHIFVLRLITESRSTKAIAFLSWFLLQALVLKTSNLLVCMIFFISIILKRDANVKLLIFADGISIQMNVSVEFEI